MALGALLAVGTGLQMLGMYQGAQARKRAARQNAAYYREQKRLQELATRRELDIFERESEMFSGSQVSAFAKSGVDFSGSLLAQYAGDRAAIAREKGAIKAGAAVRMRLTEMRAAAASDEAKAIDRALPLQLLGTGISAYASYKAMSNRSSLQDQLNQMRVDAAIQRDRPMQILEARHNAFGGMNA